MKTYTIKQKMSGTGTIHDIASDLVDRDIVFRGDTKYAVVLAAYYGGKGYTTHKTGEAVIRQTRRVRNYSYDIIDTDGHKYYSDGWTLCHYETMNVGDHIPFSGTTELVRIQ